MLGAQAPQTSYPVLAPVYMDSDLSVQAQVQRSITGCFAVLRQLRSIRRDVPSSVYQSVVVALVLSRLDYDNGGKEFEKRKIVRRLGND